MSCTVVRTLLSIHQHHLGDMKGKDRARSCHNKSPADDSRGNGLRLRTQRGVLPSHVEDSLSEHEVISVLSSGRT